MADHNGEPALHDATGARLGERGMALLVVLWIVASAALLVSAFNATARSGATFVASEVQLTKMDAILDAGVEIAAAQLIKTDKQDSWQPDGRARDFNFNGSRLSIAIADPGGQIDLNKAREKLLLGFFKQFAGSASDAAEISAIILRARGVQPGADKDEDESASDESDENQDDVAADEPEPLMPFLDVTQFAALDGIKPELYSRVAPHLTVYSRDGKINALAASDEVLASVPKLAKSEIKDLREALRKHDPDDDKLTEIMEHSGAYLSTKSGPAYVVTVFASTPGSRYRAGKVFVIAMALDKGAPYRLISKRALALAD